MDPAQATCEQVALGQIVSNPKGGKTASFTCNGRPLKLLLKNMTTPFEVSSFTGTGDRKSLDLRASPDLAAFCERLDQKMKALGFALGCEQYRSPCKPQRGDYPPLFRCKLTLSDDGSTPVKFYEHGTQRRLTNEEIAALPWKECTMNLLVRISSVYVQSGCFGPLCTPEAIMVRQEAELPLDLLALAGE